MIETIYTLVAVAVFLSIPWLLGRAGWFNFDNMRAGGQTFYIRASGRTLSADEIKEMYDAGPVTPPPQPPVGQGEPK